MSKGQKWYVSHAEVLTQNVLGIIIALIILKLWGMSTTESLTLQAIFFVTSYIRGYIVRRFFNSLEERGNEIN